MPNGVESGRGVAIRRSIRRKGTAMIWGKKLLLSAADTDAPSPLPRHLARHGRGKGGAGEGSKGGRPPPAATEEGTYADGIFKRSGRGGGNGRDWRRGIINIPGLREKEGEREEGSVQSG